MVAIDSGSGSKLEAPGLAAALELAQQAEAAAVLEALSQRGIPHLLLKGRAVQEALYSPDERRLSVDLDVLVPCEELPTARTALSELGLHDPLVGAHPEELIGYAEKWLWPRRQISVDLHWSLLSVTAPPEDVWRELSGDPAEVGIGGRRAPTTGEPGLALVLALHAAQHGAGEARPVDELRRAIDGLDPGSWERAATLAGRLGATAPFSLGLSLVPQGVALMTRLGVSAEEPAVEAVLRARTAPRGAIALNRFSEARGTRARMSFAGRKLFPTPPTMRAIHPLARRGLSGLALAYAWRVPLVLWRLPRGFAAWLRAKRGAS